MEESARLMSECAEKSLFAEPSVYRSFEEVVQFIVRECIMDGTVSMSLTARDRNSNMLSIGVADWDT